MRKVVLQRTGMISLLVIILLSCSLLPVERTQPAHTDTQTPRPSAIVPAVTATPSADFSGEYAGSVKITGSMDFVRQTHLALALLEAKAPDAYRKVQTYVGVIMQGEHSGMWAWEEPPRYEVGDRTAFSSVTWYASTIAHDATHSELYHNGQEWEGIPAEQFCNAYQLDVLKRIGAPQFEIDYMAGLKGDHCDMDGDGDCDWADYEKRDW